MAVRSGTFYPIWPVLDGQPLNLQWGEIRSNTAETKAIVRNSVQELETGVDELNALRALLGQEYGDLDFRNKYRFFYESTTEEMCCQKNDGTVDTPIWVDAWCVRFNDGQFQVVSKGGIQSNAGFYGPDLQTIEEVGESGSGANNSVRNPSKLFFNSDDGFDVETVSSGENAGEAEVRFTQPFGKAQEFTATGKVWEIEHEFGVAPVLVQVMDTDRRVLIPDRADVSNPDIAYFYFNDNFSGSVYIASGGIGAAEIAPRDPFYLVVRTDEQSSDERRLHPNANLVFDNRYFYVNVDLDPGIVGPPSPTAYLSVTDAVIDSGVTLNDGTNLYAGAKEINFNSTQFYLSGDLDGEPVVNNHPNPTFNDLTLENPSSATTSLNFNDATDSAPKTKWIVSKTSTNAFAIWDFDNSNNAFQIFPHADNADALIIGSGKVGVLQSPTTYEFEVNGTVDATAVRTTGGTGGEVFPLTVKESDGSPSVDNVKTVVVNSGSLTDDGSGQVTLDWTTTPQSITASFVVAASDAPQKYLDNADYVCDGTDDDVQIQAAIDALSSDGGRVILSEGTFTTTSSITITADHVHVQGQGPGATEVHCTADTAVFDFAGTSGAGVIDRGGLSSLLVRGAGLANTSAHGVQLTYVNRTLVENLIIHSTRNGINFANVWQASLMNISVHGAGSDQNFIGLMGDSSVAGGDNAIIAYNFQTQETSSDGIRLKSYSGSKFTSCEVGGAGGKGWNIGVADNSLRNEFLHVSNCLSDTITNEAWYIDGSGALNAEATDMQFSNIWAGSASHGLRIINGTNVIFNNVFFTTFTEHAVEIQDSARVDIHGGYIDGWGTLTPSTYDGIKYHNSSKCIAEGIQLVATTPNASIEETGTSGNNRFVNNDHGDSADMITATTTLVSGNRGDPSFRGAFCGAIVKKSGNESVSNASNTVPVWHNEVYDVGGWFASSGDDMFTVPTGIAYVKVSCQIKMEGNANGRREATILKGGSEYAANAFQRQITIPGTTEDIWQVVSPPMAVSAGDTITVRVYQDSGSALNIIASDQTYFAIEAVSS